MEFLPNLPLGPTFKKKNLRIVTQRDPPFGKIWVGQGPYKGGGEIRPPRICLAIVRLVPIFKKLNPLCAYKKVNLNLLLPLFRPKWPIVLTGYQYSVYHYEALHSFFIRNSTLFEKATLRTKMFLTLLKRLVLVLKFNFLFPKSLDILKEYNENASLSSEMVLNKKNKAFFFGSYFAFFSEKKLWFLIVLVLIKKSVWTAVCVRGCVCVCVYSWKAVNLLTFYTTWYDWSKTFLS